MSTMASQITSLTIVYSTVYSGADQRKHQRSATLGFVREIHRWPVNSPHKGPVTRKMFPFDDVIMEDVRKAKTYSKSVIAEGNLSKITRLNRHSVLVRVPNISRVPVYGTDIWTINNVRLNSYIVTTWLRGRVMYASVNQAIDHLFS